MENGKVFIWMQLLGFNRDDPDRGAKRFLEQTGFIPDGACALLFHADFFHQHRGMAEQYTLPPDNCAYYGTPRNAERERQPWTNHDLRDLARNLEAEGSHLYASVMGNYLNNTFHHEWASDHPEILNHATRGKWPRHFALKRFRDGTYYEDFFIDKLCQALADYGMKGVHLADCFCPPSGGMLHFLEFSTDYFTQFTDRTGIEPPEAVAATLGVDDAAAESLRAGWTWKNCREEWVRFNAWRWEGFFQKLCARVHAIGKEVIVLGMYCTDPFETLYCIGIDLKRIVAAGVDYISANILPTSCYIAGVGDQYPFHRYMAIAPLTAAHLPKGHLISMLGVQDATEEWDAMHHAPCLHERDMYAMMAYQLVDRDGICRALDGFFLCLGDGIHRQDWDWERERLEIALSAGDAACLLSPAMLWSDAAYDAMLHEYIHTRRWTPFKLFYELGKAGTLCGAAVRSDALENYSGALVVPNFDMLSQEEKRAVAAYDRGAVLCTARPGFDPAAWGIEPAITLSDRFSNWPLSAFAFGCEVEDGARAAVEALLAVDDGAPNLSGPPEDVQEYTYTPVDTLPFAKVTTGFRDALARLLMDIAGGPFTVDKPFLALKLTNGAIRLYLFNDNDRQYGRAFVSAKHPIQSVQIVSKFPILPPRFLDAPSGSLTHLYAGDQSPKRSFEIKLPPGGVTIVDVTL